MKRAIAHHLRRYADWCDDVPPRAAGAAVRAASAARLPAPVSLTVGALAGVLAAVDLAPKRALALRATRLLL